MGGTGKKRGFFCANKIQKAQLKFNARIMKNTEIEVEFCNKCGYSQKFEELKDHIQQKKPNVVVHGREGRRGSFEVVINGSLVHSKLQTLAYPDYDDLETLIKDAEQGKALNRQCKQQPITSCSIS